MSKVITDLICDYLEISESESYILLKTSRQLSREERKLFYQEINPNSREMKLYFKEVYEKLSEEEKEAWKKATIESMLNNGGEPDLSDGIIIDILGRFNIYKKMREEAKEREISLKIGSTSGGCVTFIVVITTIALIISFLSDKFK